MPSQGIDFGSNLYNYIASDDGMNHEHIPGAWLGHSGNEEDDEFSDANMTRSKAKAIADSSLADLQRATSQADNDRLHRQVLRERRAEAGDMLVNVTPKGSKALTWRSLKSLQSWMYEEEVEKLRREISGEHHASEATKGHEKPVPLHPLSVVAPSQNNGSSVASNKPRRSRIGPSFNSGESPNKLNHAAPAQRNVSNTPASVPSRPIDSSLNSGEQKAGRARAHDRGFLSLMDDFNARGGEHTAATRRLVDGGLFSENQLADAAERAKSRADARAGNGEVSQEDRLAALRTQLANKGRVIATASQRASDSTMNAVRAASRAPVRPESSQVLVAQGTPNLPAQPKVKSFISAGTAQPGLSTADGVKQPVGNNLTLRQILANESRPEIEVGRRSTSHFASRTLPINDFGHAPKSCSSPKPAAAAAASETSTTPIQSVSEKVQAILRRYGGAMNICDDASAAAFVAHKLKEGTRYADIDAGKTPSTPVQLKTSATPKFKSTSVQMTKPDMVKTAETDDGFDVLTNKGPSAANGSTLPDPDSIKDQLDMQFSPTLKGFQGWEDDYDSDDSEEWDLGGLAEWKWVGEKSAKESSAAKRKE